ncbi:unnamed protein product [Rhizopus stolonifer]
MANVTSDESGDIHPDATISKIHQRDFGPSLGFGEAKIARHTTDNHSLCHNLLRLATLAKDIIDGSKLQAALTFQIYRFNITFFFDTPTTRWNVSHARNWSTHASCSLEELVSFVDLKNIRTLLMITEAFWRLRRSVNDGESWNTEWRPTHPSIYALIHSTKDRHRFCTLRFV